MMMGTHHTCTIPYHTTPHHTIPYHTIPYQTCTIPYHTIPYHTIPYRTMPYHRVCCGFSVHCDKPVGHTRCVHRMTGDHTQWSCAQYAALYGVGNGECDANTIATSENCDDDCKKNPLFIASRCPKTCGTCNSVTAADPWMCLGSVTQKHTCTQAPSGCKSYEGMAAAGGCYSMCSAKAKANARAIYCKDDATASTNSGCTEAKNQQLATDYLRALAMCPKTCTDSAEEAKVRVPLHPSLLVHT